MGIRNILVTLTVAIALVGCSVSKDPPFASSGWALNGNVASSVRHGVAINFGGESVFPMTNMSDGEYDLHFITDDEQFQAYDPYCRDYIASAISKIPLTIHDIYITNHSYLYN